MGYIYILTSPSGRSYIGQTIRPIEKRFQEHQNKKSCAALHNAIRKYGWKNFEKDWYECPDENLNFEEELLVREMGTLSPDGYNLKEGGGSTGKTSEESKQKQREAKIGEKNPNFGISKSDETKQKLREANVGKTHSAETKQKMTETRFGENNHRSKRVYQYDLQGTLIASFESTREAGRHLKKNDGSKINKCARGNQKVAYGFKWSYTEY